VRLRARTRRKSAATATSAAAFAGGHRACATPSLWESVSIPAARPRRARGC